MWGEASLPHHENDGDAGSIAPHTGECTIFNRQINSMPTCRRRASTTAAAVVLWLAGSLAALFGWLAAGLLVGRRVFEAFRATHTPPMLEIAAGVAVLSLLSAIPCAGPLFTFLLTCWGLGAVILARCGTVPYPPRESASTSPTSPTEEVLALAESGEPMPADPEADEAKEKEKPSTAEEDDAEQETEES